jgi:hypothetical protein
MTPNLPDLPHRHGPHVHATMTVHSVTVGCTACGHHTTFTGRYSARNLTAWRTTHRAPTLLSWTVHIAPGIDTPVTPHPPPAMITVRGLP